MEQLVNCNVTLDPEVVAASEKAWANTAEFTCEDCGASIIVPLQACGAVTIALCSTCAKQPCTTEPVPEDWVGWVVGFAPDHFLF